MSKIEEAQRILKALGLPPAQQNEMSALTLFALVGLGPQDSWTAATRAPRRITKEIMYFVKANYNKVYAANTRETFRRQVLHQFVQAQIAEYNPFEPDLPTNSPKAHYAISEEALQVIQAFGSPLWEGITAQFVASHGSLANTYAMRRSTGTLVPLTLPDGSEIKLSPGKHNKVQKSVIEEFAPRFAPRAKLIYLGDTAKKNAVMDTEALASFGLSISEHDKLPDIVLYDSEKKWVFLIEVVTSHGPMSPKRLVELQSLMKGITVGVVYMSAFPDMAEFRRHMKNIAWETEVWIADIPEHMIHFNGDKFLGPR